jgi:dynein heavy chain
MSAFQLF